MTMDRAVALLLACSLGLTAAATTAPSLASPMAPAPVRWNTGAAMWTTDRGLEGGLNRFLYSDRGVSFLDQQTRSYVPYAPR
jgi:hypothetical protein